MKEWGIDITGETPKAVTLELVRAATVVVVLGRDARLDPIPGPRFETWETDEPCERGIDGIERMRLIRDDIAARIAVLTRQLLARP